MSFEIGTRVKTGSGNGKVVFCGQTKFEDGEWVGIILDGPTGKSNGTVQGVAYFQCEPNFGVFVEASAVELEDSAKKSGLKAPAASEIRIDSSVMSSSAGSKASPGSSPVISPAASSETLTGRQTGMGQRSMSKVADHIENKRSATPQKSRSPAPTLTKKNSESTSMPEFSESVLQHMDPNQRASIASSSTKKTDTILPQKIGKERFRKIRKRNERSDNQAIQFVYDNFLHSKKKFNPSSSSFWIDYNQRKTKRSPKAWKELFSRHLYQKIHRHHAEKSVVLSLLREIGKEVAEETKKELEKKFSVKIFLDTKARLLHWIETDGANDEVDSDETDDEDEMDTSNEESD